MYAVKTQNMTDRFLLLEKVTVTAQHREGGRPVWTLTTPTEQFAVGVHTWRTMNGAWVDNLYRRQSEETFVCWRVRMIDRAHPWRGFPNRVELYDIVGELGREVTEFDPDDMTEMLLAGIRRVTRSQGLRRKLK